MGNIAEMEKNVCLNGHEEHNIDQECPVRKEEQEEHERRTNKAAVKAALTTKECRESGDDGGVIPKIGVGVPTGHRHMG